MTTAQSEDWQKRFEEEERLRLMEKELRRKCEARLAIVEQALELLRDECCGKATQQEG